MSKKLNTILKEAKRKRSRTSYDSLDNILFLDFDGVINTDIDNYGDKPFNTGCVRNICTLCREYNLKIVVSSSWRKYPDYEDLLRIAGFDKDIIVLGRTSVLDDSREEEIKQYLAEHIYIDKFVIVDDTDFDELTRYHIKTEFSKGFDLNKLEEARVLLNDLQNSL